VLRLRRTSEGTRDEGERPFWISFADLMTALMVLFLVVMVVALVNYRSSLSDQARIQEENRQLRQEKAAAAAVNAEAERLRTRFWDQLEESSRGVGVNVNRRTAIINLGERGQFAQGRTALDQQDVVKLRRLAPLILAAADSPAGRQVVEQVTVEGYASPEGEYLDNLHLSANRSQRVICTLLEDGGPEPLSEGDKDGVRRLFSTGGFSSNNLKENFEASRRVEIKVVFTEPGKKPTNRRAPKSLTGSCPLTR
jgi:outer membrane protein OmpA-like peptidoglycan-associated protein